MCLSCSNILLHLSQSYGIMQKTWGVILCDGPDSMLLNELTTVYDKNDALKIYCIAILRVCNSSIRDYKFKAVTIKAFSKNCIQMLPLQKIQCLCSVTVQR